MSRAARGSESIIGLVTLVIMTAVLAYGSGRSLGQDADPLVVGLPAPTQTPAAMLTPPLRLPARPAAHPAAKITPTPSKATPADLGIMVDPPAAALPYPAMVNGLPTESFIRLPPEVIDNVRTIYAHGQAIGRDPHAFTRLGDSTIEAPHFLTRFDSGPYHLGDYAGLQRVIDHYAGSFDHRSAAVMRGLHTWSVLDPMWAPADCLSAEHMLDCEIRRHNPSVIFIRLGSNDAGVPDSTERNLRRIIETCISRGVVPVIGTKADRFEGPSNENNIIMRRLAAEYAVPLWDFDRVAGTLPGRGLDQDGIHMTSFYAHDWRQAAAFQRGHGLHNLTALMMLDALLLVLPPS